MSPELEGWSRLRTRPYDAAQDAQLGELGPPHSVTGGGVRDFLSNLAKVVFGIFVLFVVVMHLTADDTPPHASAAAPIPEPMHGPELVCSAAIRSSDSEYSLRDDNGLLRSAAIEVIRRQHSEVLKDGALKFAISVYSDDEEALRTGFPASLKEFSERIGSLQRAGYQDNSAMAYNVSNYKATCDNFSAALDKRAKLRADAQALLSQPGRTWLTPALKSAVSKLGSA